jgi:hypothetical protein
MRPHLWGKDRFHRGAGPRGRGYLRLESKSGEIKTSIISKK